MRKKFCIQISFHKTIARNEVSIFARLLLEHQIQPELINKDKEAKIEHYIVNFYG